MAIGGAGLFRGASAYGVILFSKGMERDCGRKRRKALADTLFDHASTKIIVESLWAEGPQQDPFGSPGASLPPVTAECSIA